MANSNEQKKAAEAQLFSMPGRLGENLSPNQALFPYLVRGQVEMPANSKLGSESDLLRDIMYAKILGHGEAYSDLADTLTLLNSKTVTHQNPDGTTDEFTEISNIDHITAETPTVKMVEKDGVNEYVAVRLVTQTPGIIAQVLVSPNSGKMKVLFRGTSDGATGKADLEIGGPGFESFKQDRDAILSQINNIVGRFGINDVTITGHSLGGALAQQCQQSMIDAAAQNKGMPSDPSFHIPVACRNHLSAISNLSGYFYNSAGVAHSLRNRNEEALKFLANNNSNLKVSGNYFLVGGDLVQQTGETSIFANVPKEHALVSVAKINNGNEKLGTPMTIAGAALGAKAGLAAGSFLGPVGGALGLALGGITGAIAGIAPAAVATHCNGHFTEQPTQSVSSRIAHNLSKLNPFGSKADKREIGKIQYDLYTNETPKGQEVISQKLNNKSKMLNHPVTQALQKELVSAARNGGLFSLGGVAAGIGIGGSMGAIAGPVGIATGAALGAMAGLVAGNHLKSGLTSAGDYLVNAASEAGRKVISAVSETGRKVVSAVKSAKDYFSFGNLFGSSSNPAPVPASKVNSNSEAGSDLQRRFNASAIELDNLARVKVSANASSLSMAKPVAYAAAAAGSASVAATVAKPSASVEAPKSRPWYRW